MDSVTAGTLSMTRLELVEYCFSRPEKSFVSKFKYLTQHIIEKTQCPPEKIHGTKHILSNFRAGFEVRFSKAQMKKSRFISKNTEWLQKTETFPIYSCRFVTKPGRPNLSFQESSDRSKRRKCEVLRQSTSTSELCYAASMNLRSAGQLGAADIIKEIAISPESYKLKTSAIPVGIHQLSPEKALAFFINGRFSVNQYKLIRKTDRFRFPSYNVVHETKKACLPPEENFNITERCAAVTLQALLDHTADRIIQLQDEVLSSLRWDRSETVQLVLTVKWGCDGASGMSTYKQRFEDSSTTDASIFLTSIVPIRLGLNDTILWANPKPSSSRFCRPVKLEYIHETTASTQAEITRINNEIDNLVPLRKMIGNISFTITYKLLFTMIDNKICNAATETASSQRCYLCQATSKQFNCLNAVLRREVNTSYTKFGLSPLHCWIRLFECLLHISYNLPFEKWQAASNELKKNKLERKQDIQAQFFEKLGLIVDKPKQNYGSSNDGNTARRFFQNAEISSQITGINKNLIMRFHNILIAISCGFNINVEVFRNYCLKTAVVYLKLYPWYYMPTSLHKLLIHSSEIIAHFAIPIGALSEEAQECRNRDIKHYRQSFSRKCSRKANITDIFNRLLVSSDPLLSSLQELPRFNSKTIPQDVIKMLKAPEIPESAPFSNFVSSDEDHDST